MYIYLRGQVKGEHDIICHILPLVSETSSGIHMKKSLYWLLTLKAYQDPYDRPAVSNIKEDLFSTQIMDDCLKEGLADIYDTHRELFPKTITSVEELRELYQVYMSLRRTSDTCALEMRVSGDGIDIVNR